MLTIRKATCEDAEMIASLASVIWNEYFTFMISKEQISYMLDKFQSTRSITKQINEEGYTYYLFLEDDALVGYLGVIFNSEKTFLSKLYMHDSVRGKGYASKAIKLLIEECKKLGCHYVWLTCNKHNDDTIAKYKHFGFEVFDSVEADIGNGYIMDDYYMKKTF